MQTINAAGTETPHTPLQPGADGAQPILEVSHLVINYGRFTAVNDVSFNVLGGEIFGLLGPNGAGKTSTISAIETLVKPHGGHISVMGYDTRSHALECKANMGVQLQSTSFQQELPLNEILILFAGLYGMPFTTAQATDALSELQLGGMGNKRFAQLSGGQQQRLSLYLATMHRPPLLILDEPTTGLDPQSRRRLWERIEEMRDKGHGVLLTTHSMEEAESLCDRICIIDHGKVVAGGVPQEIINEFSTMPAVQRASRRGRVTLEDVFIGLTGNDLRD